MNTTDLVRPLAAGILLGCLLATTSMRTTRAEATNFFHWAPPATCSVDPFEYPRMGFVYNQGYITHDNPSLDPKLSIHCPLVIHGGKTSAGNPWGAYAEDFWLS